MVVIASGDEGILSFAAVICPNAKGTVFAGATSGADTMTVAVENVRCPVVLNSPFAKGSFEVFKGREGVAFVYHRHFDRSDARAVIRGWGIRGVRRLASGTEGRAACPGTESAA